MKGWKRKAGVHYNIGEKRVSGKELDSVLIDGKRHIFELDPVYLPTKWDLANPPDLVIQRARYYNTQIKTLWCNQHGQFCTVIPVREGAYPKVDFSECQCPGCIEQGVYYTGQPVPENRKQGNEHV